MVKYARRIDAPQQEAAQAVSATATNAANAVVDGIRDIAGQGVDDFLIFNMSALKQTPLTRFHRLLACPPPLWPPSAPTPSMPLLKRYSPACTVT